MVTAATAKITVSAKDVVILRALAIVSASLSITAGLPMLYWFWALKKRTFRHQLIMLLIVSDFFKALCEGIYPAATIVSGSLKNDVLCDSLGFFTAVFIDASDFAILLIATHTALSIFAPSHGNAPEHTGLYRWRHTMYALWVLYPITLSSLAFLNKNPAYTSATSWCFLPIRPFYWRVALSWGPRYFILLYIIVLYVSIFVYVKLKFHSIQGLFELSSSSAGQSSASLPEHTSLDLQETHVQHVAELDTHNLVLAGEPARDSDRANDLVNNRLPQSVLLTNDLDAPFGKHVDVICTEEPKIPTNLRLNDSAFPVLADPMLAERLRIIKQLRLVFVFPLVYFLMWILPFGYHTLQYNDKALTSPVLSLAYITAFIIPLHGLVDVIVYAGSERPWRSWRGLKNFQKRRSSRTPPSSDPTDLVAQRHFAELKEAELRRIEREVQVRNSGVKKDWWDSELDINDTRP